MLNRFAGSANRRRQRTIALFWLIAHTGRSNLEVVNPDIDTRVRAAGRPYFYCILPASRLERHEDGTKFEFRQLLADVRGNPVRRSMKIPLASGLRALALARCQDSRASRPLEFQKCHGHAGQLFPDPPQEPGLEASPRARQRIQRPAACGLQEARHHLLHAPDPGLGPMIHAFWKSR